MARTTTASDTAAPSAEAAWAAKMERLRRRVRPRKQLRICDDDTLRTAVTAAEKSAERARFLAEAAPDDQRAARHAAKEEAALQEARDELDAASDFLTFLALPRPTLEDLLGDHPPTAKQAEDGSVFNPDTFPAALIAASSLDGMSEEEAAELLTSWSAPDANALWEAAWQVQQETRIDLGKG
ncbi:hypothetical protein [Streptomyces jumonjinensis]|uniref:Uncharacterized protein n=1 Tax=Streptomyces jumonjinensis TaxID=1945 RepID=A0A646KTJ4_STRJU|nr:hypothetical protein [Streptomyces jumonjinensis]MQT05428.1 hypothetical protein [Streptomyces jumonjinensis]